MNDYAQRFASTLPSSNNQHIKINGRHGAGDSLLLAGLWKKHNRPILFLAPDPATAAFAMAECAFFAPDAPLHFLPDWGCLPYDRESPSLELQGERISALASFANTNGITIATAHAALLPCPPPAHIAARAFQLRVGNRIHPDTLMAGLIAGGYARVDRVLVAGECAMYGGQVDIFPPGAKYPCRLVLFDDEIEEIRLFSPADQRSLQSVQQAEVLPPGECDLSPTGIENFCRAYRQRFADFDDADGERVCNGHAVAGMESWLPLFFENAARLTDYAPPNLMVVFTDSCRQSLTHFMQQAQRRQRNAEVYDNRATLPAEELFLPPDELFNRLSNFSLIELCGNDNATPQFSANYRRDYSHTTLANYLREADGDIILTAANEGRLSSLCGALNNANITTQQVNTFASCFVNNKNETFNNNEKQTSLSKKQQTKIYAVVAPLRGGFSDCGLTVLTEAEIYDTRPQPPRRRRYDDSLQIDELLTGQLVVHRDYGIGRYLGMEEKNIGDKNGEFLCIEYADNQRLWLPITHLHLLTPHGGSQAELSTLGSSKWRRARARADKQAHDTAARLLDIQARRRRATGISHNPDPAMLARFADGFPFTETADQSAAIDAVLADMRNPKPMDRLITADVGFGKTEVAMRAACAAALSGTQTAVLAPTTLLAEQHAQTFAARFVGFPVKLATLNRLSVNKKKALADIQSGNVDIVIGTHALLQPTVQFKRLGLLIIDEEHRFGVRQKEHFKSLRADIDVLSLSATPIPRTMGMALEGLRTLSIINTPPPMRLPIRTTVSPFSRELIIDACERELLRGGQIYFVHNDISGLATMQDLLEEWLPNIRIAVVHGGMPAASIERAMRRFIRRDVDLLLCTIIIESGLDIANANTIIINRADRMGVSRLHQLRGRVGRTDVQAHALLLSPPDDISRSAKTRLQALSSYADVGSGLALALRDMEIRGMGEILGERQSGDIAAVGVHLYQRLLNTAVRQLEKDGTHSNESDGWHAAAVELPSAALLPSNYVHSPTERLRYYRALSICADVKGLENIKLEWQDRFGKLPTAANQLIFSHQLRLMAATVGACSIRPSKNNTAHIEFATKPTPTAHHNLLSQIKNGVCRLHRDGKTIVLDNMPEAHDAWAQKITTFLQSLANSER